ncbi:peptide chain release factor N(5)-glutamine methyltransferase [uncultured Alistipes sp.]|uniref:peptide chain release factor N(5)-glutamine methyltransferase n=1 Tax=uncultured Alistipes sp. TaxID=538949 RepID=UPI002634DB93|nr:peptide chain release factor N(5)-glutamine methyltransferase [uncultured Alistipes sp.]
MTTRRDILARIAGPLESLYGAHEARQIALTVVSDRTGIQPAALLADPGAPLDLPDLARLVAELAAGRPVQYVLGAAEFCGLRIGVREGVLIPRPETEELVLRIASEHRAARSILDVGTGSGCIALALKSLLPDAVVTGADLSPEALAVARGNAAALGLDVAFVRADALRACGASGGADASGACGAAAAVPGLVEACPGPYDVVVSNPPYVPESERGALRRNVAGYEPAEALFVPDDDPLRFYRAIARAARGMLRSGGALCFEIHEAFGGEMLRLGDALGYRCCELFRDFRDRPRTVRFRQP